MSKVVKERFARLAKNYDFFNHFFSMGTDIRWRDEAAREAMLKRKSFAVLDSASGTGDLAFAVRAIAQQKGKDVRIVGTDFAPEMLQIAKQKAKDMGVKNVEFRAGDSLRTGYKKNAFDVITTGFSLRNFDDVDKFLRESYRILKKGGRLVILEMALPDRMFDRQKFYLYSLFIKLYSLFTDEAYNWLVGSIINFDKHAFREKVARLGFKHVRMRELESGVAFLLTAEK